MKLIIHFRPVCCSSVLVGPNSFLGTQCSDTLSPSSSLNVSDQDSHPYKTTEKIIIVYV
jgi:hypothetical protein